MNRRRFLRLLGLGIGTAAFDPEKLLWIPGQKKIFIPNKIEDNLDYYLDSLMLERITPHITLLFENQSRLLSYLKEPRRLENLARSLKIPESV